MACLDTDVGKMGADHLLFEGLVVSREGKGVAVVGAHGGVDVEGVVSGRELMLLLEAVRREGRGIKLG